MVAGIPPVSVWWLGLFAWVPLLVVAGSNSPRRAGILGWLQGALAQGCALAGAVPAMARTGGASTTVAILFGALLVAYEGARIGLVAFVTAHALRRSWPIGWAFPVVLVSVELTYPMIFPWTTQLFLDGAPILQQGAELGGPLATSAWVALLDASLARAWFARKDKAARLRHGVLAPALILVVVVAYGGARIHSVRAQMREAPTLTLGLIQENVTDVRTETRDPVALYRDASLALVSREKVDLLVWP
jgi:apolipoprotein N-acyltransferase